MTFRRRAATLTPSLLLLALLAALLPGTLGVSHAKASAAPGAAGGDEHPALADTPPMGWNSWNRFGCDIDEDLIRQTADAMVSSGMRDAGYEYVNLDDCWMAPARDADGRLQPDPARFPGGIDALADYVHSLGLKLGIYSTAGTGTCQRLPGSLDHEAVDAQTFAEWGVDYLKYDHCFTEKAALPGLDRLTLRGAGPSQAFEAEGPSVTRTGTARTASCSGCSGGAQVVGAGRSTGAVSLDVSVPVSGTYELVVDYTNGEDPRTAYYPTGYVSVDGQRRGDRLRFPRSAGAQAPAPLTVPLTLTAGTHTLQLANPYTDLQIKQDLFSRMRDALQATGRPIVYSINPNTQDGTSFEGIAHLWRTTQDIKPLWHSTSWYRGVGDIIRENADEWTDAGPGHWNDPDMLEVGVGLPGFPGLTDEEERTHFTMWALMAAPLIAGADLRSLDVEDRDVLLNERLIRVDQDPRGVAGRVVRDDGATQVWAKPLVDGSAAVVLYNAGSGPIDLRATATEAGLPSARSYRVLDLWSGDLDHGDGTVAATVPAHGVAAYRIKPLGRRP
jgi:alpha-galactosidase